MDFVATLFSTGWASGINSYLTVALLGILGRLDVGAVPPDLERTPVIAVALALFGLEFVIDKIPGADSVWDAIHTVVRPLVAVVLGFQFAGESGITGVEEALGAGSSGAVALASHSAKAGLRLGINTSPEPASNIFASLTEDGLVAVVILFSINHPVLAAVLAGSPPRDRDHPRRAALAPDRRRDPPLAPAPGRPRAGGRSDGPSARS